MTVGGMPVHAQATTAPHDTRLPNGMRVERAISLGNAKSSIWPAQMGAPPAPTSWVPGAFLRAEA